VTGACERKNRRCSEGDRGAADRVKTENLGGENERRSATDIDCTVDVCGVHASTRRLSSVGGREAVSENPVDNDRRSVTLRRR